MIVPRHTCVLALAALAASCGPSGSAPELQNLGDQVVGVNEELVLIVQGSDPDGDELVYNFATDIEDIKTRANPASISRLPTGAAEFRWTPLAADVGEHAFDFTVTDGEHTSTHTIQIAVKSAVGANSAPRFVRPAGMGTTIDLARGPCVELEIELVDSDSSDVRIREEEPKIEGALLEGTSGLSALWRWCPTPEQQAADDRYILTLSADDGDNAKIMHPYLIVLRKKQKQDCPGEGPVVAHTPADVSSSVGLTITAQITDDMGLKREPLLYVSTVEPSEPLDLTSSGPFTQHTMQLLGGNTGDGTWRATIPNPVASSAVGSQATLYYVIVAQDDDDAAGDCDHLTQAPDTATFQMTVTNPGGAGGAELCEACTTDSQCGGADDLCVRVGANSSSFCLEDCSGQSDCPTDYECSSTPIESIDGASARQCVPVSNDCSNPGGTVCADDSFEDNDSREQSFFNPLLSVGSHDAVSCPLLSGAGDDEDWFEILLTEDAEVTLNLSGTSASDLDLSVFDDDGILVTASQSFTSTESISQCLPAGFYTVRVFAFSPAQNPYTLTYSKSASSCSGTATCQADTDEDDDDAASARTTSIFPDPHVSETNSICAGDQDWYRAFLVAGETAVVDLTFEHSDGDLDLYLFDIDGTTPLTPCCNAANGQSVTDNERLEFTVDGTGTYFVVVDGFNGASALYDISIGVQQ